MTIASTARKAGPLLGNGSTTSFSFSFKVFATSDIKVAIANSAGVETVLVENTHYTVSLNANQETSPGGAITYPISGSPLPSGSVLSIIGDLDYDQPLDLPSGGNFNPTALENQLDRATMQIQQLKEQVDRSAKLPQTSAADAESLVADIIRLADSADNLDTVAGSITGVNTTATNIADVNTVAGSIANVNATGGSIANVNTVAANLTGTNTIGTVAGSIANVNNTGNNIANVNTVAGISANVTTVAGNNTNVSTVAGISGNVTTVAGISGNVTTVAGISSSVTTVATNNANVSTVAGSIANVNTVAPSISSVNTVAPNISSVNTVSGSIANVNTVAGVAPDVTTVAGISGNVTTVAGISANVTTVAGNSANVTTVAGVSGDVTTVATNNANVTTVATNIASVNTNAANISAIQGAAANAASVAGALAQVNSGKRDRFVAGVGYTKNTTTQLTLTQTPAKAGFVYVFFDGVYQDSAQYSIAGAVITFTAAIPSNTVEVVYHVPVTMTEDAYWQLADARLREAFRKEKATTVAPTMLLDFSGDKRLDPRITFTRASEARYYDASTVALAEQNLLTYSQQFDNAAWTKQFVTITADSIAAPDGTTTADTLTGNGASGVHSILQTQAAIAGGKTFSVYLKVGTNNFAQIFFDGDTAPFADFDLSTGVVGTTGGSVTATITSAGSGWYRCAVYTASSTATNPRVCLVSSSTAARAESNSLSTSIYLWGAQLEQRSSVTAYTPTTTAAITNYIPVLQTAANGVARFDHNPVTRESLGLLIEEQRTNLLLRSEEFNNAAWTKTNSTINANAVVSPDGTVDADELVDNTTSGAHTVEVTPTVTSGASYTLSVYAKAYTLTKLMLQLDGNGTVATSTFNLSNGTVESTLGGSATITAVGNGWYRCAVTGTTVNTAPYVRIRLVNAASSPTYAGTGQSLFIWGAQLEAGAFATSYIPTVASQVTRSADAASMTGTNFSSWYRQDEGTIYTDFITGSPSSSSRVYHMDDGTSNNRFRLITLSNTVVQSSATVGGSNSAVLENTVASTVNTSVRTAFSYVVDNFNASSNSSAVSTDTSGAVPPGINRLLLGNGGPLAPSAALNGTIKRIAYYPVRLANATLQSLTA